MPRLSEYIREKFPLDLVLGKVRHAIQFADGGGIRMLAMDMSIDECQAMVDKVVLSPAAGNHRHVRFIGFEQERVNELGAGLDIALLMLEEAKRACMAWQQRDPQGRRGSRQRERRIRVCVARELCASQARADGERHARSTLDSVQEQ